MMNAYSINYQAIFAMRRSDFDRLLYEVDIIIDGTSVYVSDAVFWLSDHGIDILGDLKPSAIKLKAALLDLI